MLRIVTEPHGESYAILLHGRVAGEWVALLERHWRALADTAGVHRITAVLTEVSYIDAEGERLLERMAREGVELEASGCMNRFVIERIKARSGRADAAAHASRGGGRR